MLSGCYTILPTHSAPCLCQMNWATFTGTNFYPAAISVVSVDVCGIKKSFVSQCYTNFNSSELCTAVNGQWEGSVLTFTPNLRFTFSAWLFKYVNKQWYYILIWNQAMCQRCPKHSFIPCMARVRLESWRYMDELDALLNITHEYYLYHMKMCKNYKNYIFVANVWIKIFQDCCLTCQFFVLDIADY